ncbi:anti-sigma factor family protein [Streptomyces chryseus]|uniref:RNA polymerase subunit sigma n=1 Tax=Streptomyces chryseus TaxID=68186 RepID=A0ABQ3E073_9ACTN|nr:zf-HC2 domain-containing protein [Streptomyces chryseus]GGX27651.1 RNA polymerase subunit sigma [Streptomyces chryseus]GHB19187.1 RNA polymerase subunit sigma [Streptomyces chryseus]
MTTHDRHSEHDAVGAYVLGILDDAEATAFEAHLAYCEFCAAQLDDLAGMEPMMAALAESPGPPPRLTEPSPQLLTRLTDEVAVGRARRRRRGLYLVAAAAVLVIGGPAVAVVATSGNDQGRQVAGEPHPTSPAEDAFFNHMEEKIVATDASTKVSATVGMEKKAWGTHTVLELKNVKGPLKCSLIAVSKDGKEETVTSWAVPKWGYGIAGSTHEMAKNPLYVHGGAAMDRGEIDHFEVRTFDGKRLVEVQA